MKQQSSLHEPYIVTEHISTSDYTCRGCDKMIKLVIEHMDPIYICYEFPSMINQIRCINYKESVDINSMITIRTK